MFSAAVSGSLPSWVPGFVTLGKEGKAKKKINVRGLEAPLTNPCHGLGR
jgi:hypothetical protein